MQHKTLSIRQPWAWLITHGHKDIENRTWPTSYIGPLLIHAAKGMELDEYFQCANLARSLGVEIPTAASLERGGIVGIGDLIDCVSTHHSPWFFGPVGFVLTEARPLPFFQCRGQLGLFDVEIPQEVLHAPSGLA